MLNLEDQGQISLPEEYAFESVQILGSKIVIQLWNSFKYYLSPQQQPTLYRSQLEILLCPTKNS
ncbi:MAG: hypothetical protein KDD61_05905 [Bdellovibrionales bacterium]|nr:hypothetical protein [Bdellovibrionales bacterium]